MSSNAHDATGTASTPPAQQSDAQELVPGLPNHLVVTHILKPDNFDDPADLARLPAVSRATATRWRRRDFGLRRLMKNVP
jgi:hypothetical protein